MSCKHAQFEVIIFVRLFVVFCVFFLRLPEMISEKLESHTQHVRPVTRDFVDLFAAM